MSTCFEITFSDLEKAFQRLKNDRPRRSFVEYPSLISFANHDKALWMEELIEGVSKGFNPHVTKMCWAPKAHSLVRPGNILHFKDEIVFNLIVDKIFRGIFISNKKYADLDFGYQLNDPGKTNWIKESFRCWKEFQEKSVKLIDGENAYMVISDITGFYENISISMLISRLREICGASPELNLLSRCLHTWTHRENVGIPQGYSASDILAKIFANQLDSQLINSDSIHLR